MAVKLRLRRMGRKKRPFYRVVAADSRAPRDGRVIEEIGLYNPLTDPATVEIQEERALYWLSVGAIPTDTVKNLLSRQGIILKFHLKKQGLSDDKIEEELKKWEVLQLEKQRRREAAAVQAQAEETEPEEPVAEQAVKTDTPEAEKPTEAAAEEKPADTEPPAAESDEATAPAKDATGTESEKKDD